MKFKFNRIDIGVLLLTFIVVFHHLLRAISSSVTASNIPLNEFMSWYIYIFPSYFIIVGFIEISLTREDNRKNKS